jgi:hypothetical protein
MVILPYIGHMPGDTEQLKPIRWMASTKEDLRVALTR